MRLPTTNRLICETMPSSARWRSNGRRLQLTGSRVDVLYRDHVRMRPGGEVASGETCGASRAHLVLRLALVALLICRLNPFGVVVW